MGLQTGSPNSKCRALTPAPSADSKPGSSCLTRFCFAQYPAQKLVRLTEGRKEWFSDSVLSQRVLVSPSDPYFLSPRVLFSYLLLSFTLGPQDPEDKGEKRLRLFSLIPGIGEASGRAPLPRNSPKEVIQDGKVPPYTPPPSLIDQMSPSPYLHPSPIPTRPRRGRKGASGGSQITVRGVERNLNSVTHHLVPSQDGGGVPAYLKFQPSPGETLACQ